MERDHKGSTFPYGRELDVYKRQVPNIASISVTSFLLANDFHHVLLVLRPR